MFQYRHRKQLFRKQHHPLALTEGEILARLKVAQEQTPPLDKAIAEEALQAYTRHYDLGELAVHWYADPVQGFLSLPASLESAGHLEKWRGYLSWLSTRMEDERSRHRHVNHVLLGMLDRRVPGEGVDDRLRHFALGFRVLMTHGIILTHVPIPMSELFAYRLALETARVDYAKSQEERSDDVFSIGQDAWVVASEGLSASVDRNRALLCWRFLRAYEAGLGHFWVREDRIVAVPRPVLCTREGRLHCETGPAIQWPGGASFWFWQGVHVNERIVMKPETLSVDEVLGERNLEVRRVMIERIGLERLMREERAERLESTEQGTLYRLPLQGEEPIIIVSVTCPSTGRKYFLRVPPRVRRVHEAIAWTFALSINEYQPNQET